MDTRFTNVMSSLENGEQQASERLFTLVYEELRKLAAARLAQERPGQTLQPTALVNEVFLRLVAPDHQKQWDSVGHFFASASLAMRRILVENARHKKRLKRGGGVVREDFSLDQISLTMDGDELLALDGALDELDRIDPVKAKLVTLRFFGGMSIEQVCEVLGISRSTANRYWAFARAWLYQRLKNP